MSILVHLIVGQFGLLEADHLLAQLLASVGCVGMQVQAYGRWGVRLASDQPRRPMVRVTVALVVHWDNVHEHGVAGTRVDVVEGHATSGEHSVEKNEMVSKIGLNGQRLVDESVNVTMSCLKTITITVTFMILASTKPSSKQ